MSDKMTPIPFGDLMNWILEESEKGSVFGVKRYYKAKNNTEKSNLDKNNMEKNKKEGNKELNKNYEIFGKKLETPFGPAAGPHTQLAQNIITSYISGSRFFELKTVQKLDGEDLPVTKPCILADDEGYNCEWSTELYVPQAFDEYVKAWFACHVISKEFELGDMDGFQFNMSVGYDLDGIKTKKIDDYIEGMKDAGETEIFKACTRWLEENISRFSSFTKEDIAKIPTEVSNSVTVSTLHGCPPSEIEAIARYLIIEKGVNTFVKCNPTLLGYEYARNIMDEMGYDYVAFGDFHFKDDLQWVDAVPMLDRLMKLANVRDLEFGVKITNTFPVDVKAGELPSEEMYMSGKSLYPLSISLARNLAKEFDGKLRISYSGGADYFNIKEIVSAGIWPVTMATTMLKPGGYQRLEQVGILFDEVEPEKFKEVDVDKLDKLVEAVKLDRHHLKSIKPLPSRKRRESLPLKDCFFAPCVEGCPINQDITDYLKLEEEGRHKEALEVIIQKNPLPFITGTICAHNCMSKCTRNFYETPVNIRRSKLDAAVGGFEKVMAEITNDVAEINKKVAVIGGGPAGLSAAYFLARSGASVTVFEKEESCGGVVRNIIPEFRIPSTAIDNDVALVEKMGARIKTNTRVDSISELKKEYDAVVVAIGASKPGILKMDGDSAVNALDFLAEFKRTDGKVDLGREVVVIGGGNTAMDTARAAKRNTGVEKVSLIYRRTKRYMPADEEELAMAVEDGVEFAELLSPIGYADEKLLCKKMILGEYDSSGRRGVVETEETVVVDANTVIAAVGEKVPGKFYEDSGINTDAKGRPVVNPETEETSLNGVYAIGDGLNGPATVVEGIRDARKAVDAILAKSQEKSSFIRGEEEVVFTRKGNLLEEDISLSDSKRCLSCNTYCENCVEVCPNRANIAVEVNVEGDVRPQILHVDYMCNECGNCRSFCPWDGAPYLDKFTLFADEIDFENSKNNGFVVVDRGTKSTRMRLDGSEIYYTIGESIESIPYSVKSLIETVVEEYDYLLINLGKHSACISEI
ncbi:MAG: putative selenate reductase subunit YgfK [Clostridioides sp.]|jgi:putative selenate reductase|nr:putative selenate reductase subunit YgfK [Clostridioides sp.]